MDEIGMREQLRAVLPRTTDSPNAYGPTDTALGSIGGILCGIAIRDPIPAPSFSRDLPGRWEWPENP